MSDDPDNSRRLGRIEELLSHLQRDVDQLNEALIGQQKAFADLRRELSHVNDRVQRIATQDEGFDPVLEKPPHY